MAKPVQISARVSRETKEALERESQSTGVKKEFLIEQALLHHLAALHELPADVIVPPRIVVDARTAEWMFDQMETAEPTPALRDLMRENRGD